MRNKIFFVLMLAVFMVWSFSPEAYAMEKRPSSKKTASAKKTPTILKTTGKVTGCSLQNSSLSVSTNSGTSLVIVIDKNTSLIKGTKNIKLADIKNGNVVTVSYETKKNTHIARAISVQEQIKPPTPVSKNSKR